MVKIACVNEPLYFPGFFFWRPVFIDCAKETGGEYSERLSFPFSTFYERAQNAKKPTPATKAMVKEEEQQKHYL